MDDEKPKGPVDGPGLFALRVPDNDLLSHGQSVLSSACRRFTVLFGMGRGGAGGLWSSGVDRYQRSGIRDHQRRSATCALFTDA